MTDKDEIETLKQDWIAAVKARNVDRILQLATDDVVAMHPNGRTTKGKQELAADFRRFFAEFEVDQKAVSEETVISGEWAFDRGRVITTLLPVGGGPPVEVNSETVTILRREPEGSWKVARTIAVTR
jgi:uncharacterized protein (TIGR02246 family)